MSIAENKKRIKALEIVVHNFIRVVNEERLKRMKREMELDKFLVDLNNNVNVLGSKVFPSGDDVGDVGGIILP